MLTFLLLLAGPWAISFAQTQADAPNAPSGYHSLDEMIGQMLMVGFRGTVLDEKSPIIRDITEFHLGSVILFDRDVALGSKLRNIESPEQLELLTQSLQAHAHIPLFIGIDQEGGKVQRLKQERGFHETDSIAELASQPDDMLSTMSAAMLIGGQLEALGINLNFAPVLDVNINPDNPAIGLLGRSFSSNPRCVAAHAEVFIDILHDEGVLACVKHFPGHGSSATDSHLGLPDVSQSWSKAELIPFAAVIRSGRADMVMSAHLFNSSWDQDHPASLSHQVITGMLRENIGYRGVVVTDDLNMPAITDHYGLEEAIFLAIDAGSDILLFGNNLTFDPDIVPRAHAIITSLVETGRISPERIHASFQRIMRLKNRAL